MEYTLRKLYANYTLLINNEIVGDGFVKYKINGEDAITYTEFIPYATSIYGKIGLQLGKIDNWKESKESVISVEADEKTIEDSETKDLTELFSSMFINNLPCHNNIKFLKRRDIFELTVTKKLKVATYLFIHDLSALNHDPSFSQAKIVQAKDYSKYMRFPINDSDEKVIEQVYFEQ